MLKIRLNLRIVVAIAICLTGFATMFAQETGVVINGVKWATRNVDAPGTFAEKPESPGMFYQWNRNIAWASSGSITDWDSSYPNGSVWEKDNDPSPEGWRVPTDEEFRKLLNAEKVDRRSENVNGAFGYRFTDKETGNSIFFPFVGMRISEQYGALSTANCGYWSSTQDDSHMADAILIIANGIIRINGLRNNGLLVRCVAQ